jgi:hypothetical protein
MSETAILKIIWASELEIGPKRPRHRRFQTIWGSRFAADCLGL